MKNKKFNKDKIRATIIALVLIIVYGIIIILGITYFISKLLGSLMWLYWLMTQ